MSSAWPYVVISASGFMLSSIGGLGAELLDSFAGRSLEAFCRVKRNRDRFGAVLEHQDSVIRGSEYLRMIGTVLFLVAGTAALIISKQDTETVGLTWEIGSLLAWTLLAMISMMFVHSWLPEAVTRFASAPVLYHTWPFWRALSSAMNPFSIPGDVIEALTARLSGQGENEDDSEELLEDEIRTIAAAGTNAGYFGPGVREMIQNVMELNDETVGHIMTVRSDIDAVEIGDSWKEILHTVIESGRTRLPVYHETLDDIVGILYVKDLLPEIVGGNKPSKSLEELMRHAWTVPVDRSVEFLLREFLHSRSHMAIVLDEFQQTSGVVTIEDALEEIVGEIVDESDEEEETRFDVIDDHTVVVSGRVMIDDLNDRLHWDLPESDDYETIAGYVLSHLGEIPEPGANFTIGDAAFEVLQATRQKIEMMEVRYEPGQRLAV
ncbi:hemolysin family protein [Stieleria sp. JC731]|uniref:hemolysin family protein n=1 Tax=Pirellulaceae TaxID=2691357 RepID=UPI001E33D80E|nr:hemolysin family protein [Stieleria sp. JC731]MCC9601823.1 hemolysin family protein [Stieleria sp. JC731]